MGVKLYVGNLPYGVTEGELRRLFSRAGDVVSVAVPTDRLTGRPRGFAFVEMGNTADAERAARELNGHQLDDRTIRVEVAKEREERAPGFRPSGQPGMGYRGERREGRRVEGGGRKGRAA